MHNQMHSIFAATRCFAYTRQRRGSPDLNPIENICRRWRGGVLQTSLVKHRINLSAGTDRDCHCKKR